MVPPSSGRCRRLEGVNGDEQVRYENPVPVVEALNESSNVGRQIGDEHGEDEKNEHPRM